MSNITDWIKYELYPSLFDKIDQVFPEHKFQRYSGGWQSKTYLSGNPHKSNPNKTVITQKAPFCILEQGGEVLSLVDYVMKRDHIEFIEAVKKLAYAAGLQVPNSSDYNPEKYQKKRERATILEACNGYFTYLLTESTAGDKDRDRVMGYLISRGYGSEDIKAMELGYMPSKDRLVKYLTKTKCYDSELVGEAIKFNEGIGTTHRLSIPYRNGGDIVGFKFRTVGGVDPKYLNSTGLEKSKGFFNISGIKGEKDLVIVEGELDALHATAKGIDNVVAMGGSSISSEQIKDALKRGARKFTLCFDHEPGKEAETAQKLSKAIDIILQEGINKVYIAKLPDLEEGKTDPDRLIKESGAEAFRETIDGAISYYQYWFLSLINKYGKMADDKDGLSSKERDNLIAEIIETAAKIDLINKDLYIKLFTSNERIKANFGITEESLSMAVEKLTSTREKEAQSKEQKKLVLELSKLQTDGKIEEFTKVLESSLQANRMIRGKNLLPPAQSYDMILQAIAETHPALKTGYKSLDEFIGFTPGAITLIAGRPSHGKTTFMFNVLLEMSNEYKDRKFYFFTYEEPAKNISIKLLNRLINTDLNRYFNDYSDISKRTNYEFLKAYIKDGRSDVPEIEDGKRKFKELIDSQRITIVDKNYSVEELHSLIGYLSQKEKIGAVVIDYIQRMRTERKTQDKRTEIAHISDQTLQMAKDTGLPIILGAQLNRATTSQKNAKPQLENLKEAGNLEEDANTVISIYNESREKEETEEGKPSLREVDLEIKTLKNREGEVNRSARLLFDRYTGVIKERDNTPISYNPLDDPI